MFGRRAIDDDDIIPTACLVPPRCTPAILAICTTIKDLLLAITASHSRQRSNGLRGSDVLQRSKRMLTNDCLELMAVHTRNPIDLSPPRRRRLLEMNRQLNLPATAEDVSKSTDERQSGYLRSPHTPKQRHQPNASPSPLTPPYLFLPFPFPFFFFSFSTTPTPPSSTSSPAACNSRTFSCPLIKLVKS